jgi:hypothetical protein
MKYLVYKTTNKQTSQYYIGAHKTNDISDGYLGSGASLRTALKEYGEANFDREVLIECSCEEEMFRQEAEMLGDLWKTDPLCYNLKPGGKGGFDHIDNRGKNNPMKRLEVVCRCVASYKKTRAKNKDKYDEISTKNLQYAIKKNTGNTRTEHSKLMKSLSKDIWNSHRDRILDSINEEYLVTKPDGTKFITNRLKSYCKENGLAYTTLWRTSKTGVAASRGKTKGWLCQITQT